MTTNSTDQPLRECLAAGCLSRDGFLGTDPRPMADIVAADLAELRAAGLTPGRVGDFLDAILAAADLAQEQEIHLCGGKVTVRFTPGMGLIPCPFACGFRGDKGAATVILPGGRHFLVSPLSAHLIREHGFFQGRNTAFRLEPADAVQLCRLHCP